MSTAPFDRVTLTGVGRMHGATRALWGVDLEVRAGEVLTLEGPNGAGKSTLLGILATLVRPSAGTVRYGSLELAHDREQIRTALGLVAHDSMAYPDLTARETLALCAVLYNLADAAARVEAALQRAHLTDFAERPARTLSRGQLQRLALARAQLHEPAMLLFDEPTTGLDAASTERVTVAIEQARARGCMVVLVTHDAALAARVATRRAFLLRGRLERCEVVTRE